MSRSARGWRGRPARRAERPRRRPRPRAPARPASGRSGGPAARTAARPRDRAGPSRTCPLAALLAPWIGVYAADVPTGNRLVVSARSCRTRAASQSRSASSMPSSGRCCAVFQRYSVFGPRPPMARAMIRACSSRRSPPTYCTMPGVHHVGQRLDLAAVAQAKLDSPLDIGRRDQLALAQGFEGARLARRARPAAQARGSCGPAAGRAPAPGPARSRCRGGGPSACRRCGCSRPAWR